MNIEVWDPSQPQPRNVLPPPMNSPMLPDLPNWSWHEYGMRVGFWRFVNSLKSRNIIPTLALNGVVTDHYPQAVEQALKLDWELMGHGFIQRPMHKVENEYVDIYSVVYLDCERSWKVACDVALPCASQNVLNIDES